MISTITIANAPCSWGALEFEELGEAAGYERVLDEIAATGYSGTELGDWGFMPTDPAALEAALDARGLAMVGAFVPAALADEVNHQPAIEAALQRARLLAVVGKGARKPTIVLSDDNGKDPLRIACAGRIRQDQGLSDQEWEHFTRGAEAVARAVHDETGLRTVFHHHCAGFVETPAEVETLMARTDPELLGLCLDTGHFAYGGGDALEVCRAQAERIWHVHFKDCHQQVAARAREEEADYFEAVRLGLFCELGQGEVDFEGILAELRRVGYEGWIVVEQDVLPGMGTPEESARRSREFLKGLGL